MKTTLFVLAGLISFSVFAGEKLMTVADIVKEDGWSVAEGMLGEDKMFLRYRNNINKQADVSSHPKAIHIFWDYKANEKGMPSSKAESDAMGVFEARICEALESDLSGVLTAVSTKSGTRHWLFYVTDTENFSEKLHSMPQEENPYPIEIEAQTDQEWSYYFEHMYISHDT